MTRRAAIYYLLFGLLAYLLFLVWTFPAGRAVALLRTQAPQVQLAGVSGTVWSGRAATLQYKSWRLTRCTWQFRPLALFMGRVEFAIAFDGEGRRGEANAGWRYDNTIHVSAVDVTLPMAEVAPALGVPVTLNGMVAAKLDEVVVSDGRIIGAQGQLQWRQAAITEPVGQRLGDFSAQLTSESTGIMARVRDEGGPVQLDGFIRLINDGSYQFNAKANVRDPQQTLLRQALQAAGRQEADGRVALEFSGHL